ncbi:MAG: phosphoenolpyruvate carboxylase [Pseudomonadota bacterium]
MAAAAPHSDTDAFLSWCRDRLNTIAGEIDDDPMINSVQRLAHLLAVKLEDGACTLDDLDGLARHLSDQALEKRADRFVAAHPPVETPSVPALAADAPSFDAFAAEVERTGAGIVFTGHPTFALSRALRKNISQYVDDRHKDDLGIPDEKLLSGIPHRPDDGLSLGAEHEDVVDAMANARAAIDTVVGDILDHARAQFPDQWWSLNPQPVSLATWVGYDLDGRTDIHWSQTLTIRLREKAAQLRAYAQDLSAVIGDDGDHALAPHRDHLARAAQLTEDQVTVFVRDLTDPEMATRAANHLTADHADKIISLQPFIAAITAHIESAPTDPATRDLCLLRARMTLCGLGLARIHLRVNAAQVRSALRVDFGIHDDADFMGRSTLELAARQAGDTGQHSINFAAVFLEQMTARRQFMLCAQILKHIDADTPIRFLIAESEAPATIMGAVYMARAYGVADKLDISPLFETPSAMERGGRFLEQLLKEKPYQDYIRQRGRISIQLGFSDSGRFMGQIAADLAIERLHILLARALCEAKIDGVEALIFNTNGESMGRGTPPFDLEARLHHLMTPWARGRFARHNIPTNVESSFQGGEGFLHFHSPAIALRTVREIVRVTYQSYTQAPGDAFYDDINFSWDFYRALKTWQESLFANPDYTSAIATFAHRFLFTTGSRKTRRQKKGTADMSPRALRAIPHNAILQQLAIPANVACGIGSAVRQEADRLVTHIEGSPRMRALICYAARARDLTSLPAFTAYANIYNATYWIRRAARETDDHKRIVYERLASRLGDQDVYTALSRLGNHLSTDLSQFDSVLEAIDGVERTSVRREDRVDLHILHAIRQALIMHAVSMVAGLPGFSGRHEVRLVDLIDLALALNFDELLPLLDTIFPVMHSRVQALSGIKEDTSVDLGGESGYPEIQHEVREPLARIQEMMREIGVGISHAYGAYG